MTQKTFNKTLVLSALSLPQVVEHVADAPQAERVSARRTTHVGFAHGRAIAVGIAAALLGIAVVTWTHELKTATAHAARPNAEVVLQTPATPSAKALVAAPAAAVEESEAPAAVVRALPAVVIRARALRVPKRAPRSSQHGVSARPATGFARISAADVAAQ